MPSTNLPAPAARKAITSGRLGNWTIGKRRGSPSSVRRLNAGQAERGLSTRCRPFRPLIGAVSSTPDLTFAATNSVWGAIAGVAAYGWFSEVVAPLAHRASSTYAARRERRASRRGRVPDSGPGRHGGAARPLLHGAPGRDHRPAGSEWVWEDDADAFRRRRADHRVRWRRRARRACRLGAAAPASRLRNPGAIGLRGHHGRREPEVLRA